MTGEGRRCDIIDCCSVIQIGGWEGGRSRGIEGSAGRKTVDRG